MKRFEGKVALISGVARGQGRAHAIRLASEGAAIIGFDALTTFDSVPYPMPTAADLDETIRAVEEVGGKIYTSQADVRDQAALEAVVAEGTDRFGPITSVVANAGISMHYRPFWEYTESEWNDVIDVDLTGVWRTVSVAARSIIDAGKGGAVTMTGSLASIRQPPNLAPYAAAKTALVGLMRTMANDLGKYRVRVNVVAPSNVPTDLLLGSDRIAKLFRPDLDNPTLDEVKEPMRGMHLISEPWIELDDITSAVAWLLSEEARYVTGAVLPVDLGATARW